LPLQTADSLRATFDIVDQLQPDRISFLPYAHVPWIKQSQRRYTEADLPESLTRQQLYLLGREHMDAAGYVEIGLDQYARLHDPLAQALAAGALHRNFMGFSASSTQALLGLGASAIGDNRNAYSQNEKNLQQYEGRVQAGNLPLQRGHVLGREDTRIRELLWSLLTGSRTQLAAEDRAAVWWPATQAALQNLQQDGLVRLSESSIEVTALGRGFLRHIGMAFDQYLRRTH
jgi:oxygen-independent coproporphyrinogen-3 oxidase